MLKHPQFPHILMGKAVPTTGTRFMPSRPGERASQPRTETKEENQIRILKAHLTNMIILAETHPSVRAYIQVFNSLPPAIKQARKALEAIDG